MLFLSALVSMVGEGALPFEDDNISLDSLEHKRVPISCDGDNTGDEFAAAKLANLIRQRGYKVGKGVQRHRFAF